MSMYDNYEKDDLASAIDEFLKGHTIAELLDIVADAVRYHREEQGDD